MPFLQVTLDLGRRDPVPVENALFGLGAASVTLEDAADDPVLEPGPGQTPLWPTVRLRALFSAAHDRGCLASALRTVLPDGAPPYFEEIPDRPWEREWLRDFRPMRFGKRLWVCPDGQPAGDLDAVRVELDPGLAFGTGTHATTALCLAWLDSRTLIGRSVIDYGCGSGILAVAAAKLGATRVLAYDIDQQALLATGQNVERNGVGNCVQVVANVPEQPASCDLIIANILAGPLTRCAEDFAMLLRSGGEIGLSGILLEQVDFVTDAYRPWFHIEVTAARDGWALLSGYRGIRT